MTTAIEPAAFNPEVLEDAAPESAAGEQRRGDEIAPHLTVPELVRAYEASVAKIHEGFRLVHEAQDELGDAFLIERKPHFRGGPSIDSRHVSFDNADRALEKFTRETWDLIISHTEVRRMMSVARRKELDEQVRTGELPPLTVANVEQLLVGFEANLSTMLEEAVEEVFNWLRPGEYSQVHKLKTNTQLEIGRKAILGYCVSPSYIGRGFRVNDHSEGRFMALENVFSALDGKGQIHKTHWSELHNALESNAKDPENCDRGVGETTYYRFRVFRNGNAHLEFKRLDLLAKLNRIAGGRRLRPRPAGESD